MKTKYLTYARQIGPKESGHMMMLRSSVGFAGRGRQVAWVRLPDDRPGFRSRPGFGRLYFDWIGDCSIIATGRNDVATELLRHPETKIVGTPLDPNEIGHVAIYGFAWLVADEGYRCPAVKVGRDHSRRDIMDWIDQQGFTTFFEVYDDNKGLWIIQTSSNADIVRCHHEMMAELEADGEERTEEDREPPDGSAFLMMAKLRWG